VLEREFPGVLSAAVSGDEGAFARLWRDAHPPLLRYLRVVAGDAAKALAIADGAYERGADLGVLLADLLGLAHLLTRMKSVPALSGATSLPEAERTRGFDRIILAEIVAVADEQHPFGRLADGAQLIPGAGDALRVAGERALRFE